MALTFPRWMVAAVIGAAAVWLALFRAPHRSAAPSAVQSDPFAGNAAADVAGRGMAQAADRLRLLQIRDSILRETAKTRAAGLTVLIGAEYDPIGHTLDSLLRERWTTAAPSSQARVVVAAVLDSSSVVSGAVRPRVWSAPSITAFLPNSSAGSPCLSVLRLSYVIDARSSQSLRRDLFAPETIGALLGPCLYYATFGAPGTRIAQWLRDGNWRIAHVTDWQVPPPPLRPLLSARQLLEARDVPTFVYQPRSKTSTVGLACLAGEAGRCVEAVQPARGSDADSMWKRSVVGTRGATELAFRMPWSRTALGPSEEWLLSEMVRTLGKERFAAFWRSNEPVAAAFQAAANQSLDSWVHDWAVRAYGPLPTGPGIDRSGFAAGAILLIVAVGAAAAVARSRRVS